MFKNEIEAVGNTAKGKVNLLENNFTGYVLMAISRYLYRLRQHPDGICGRIHGRTAGAEAGLRYDFLSRPLLCDHGRSRAVYRKQLRDGSGKPDKSSFLGKNH